MRPGIVSKTSDGKIQCTPIRSRIVSLFAEHNELQYAVPGGLIGVGWGLASLYWLCSPLANPRMVQYHCVNTVLFFI